MGRPKATSDEAILRAAVRAITQHGPAGLTLAAVAAEAGLAAPTLVQRFGSKRGLLLAVSRQAKLDILDVFERAREAHSSPLAALLGVLGELASGVGSPQELANSLGFLQLDIADAEFREHAADYARRMHQEFTALIVDAVAAGELVEAVDTARLARSVQVVYNGVLIHWAVVDEGELVDVLLDEVDRLLDSHRA